MDGVMGKPLRLDAQRQMSDRWSPNDTAHDSAPPVHEPRPATPNVGATCRRTVNTDLVALGDALSNGDVEPALDAPHRLRGDDHCRPGGDEQTCGRARTWLQSVSDGIPPTIRVLGKEVLRTHRADFAVQHACDLESGDTDA